MNEEFEVRLSVLLENIGLLIHNGIDGEFSRIDNKNLSKLGHLLCKIQSPGGINKKTLENIEDFISAINKEANEEFTESLLTDPLKNELTSRSSNE